MPPLPPAIFEAVTKQDFTPDAAFMRVADLVVLATEAIGPCLGGPGGDVDGAFFSQSYAQGYIPFTGARSSRKRMFSAVDLFACGVFIAATRIGIRGPEASKVVQYALGAWLKQARNKSLEDTAPDAMPTWAYIAVLYRNGKVKCTVPRDQGELRIFLEGSPVFVVNAGQIHDMAIEAAQGLFERLRAIVLAEAAAKDPDRQDTSKEQIEMKSGIRVLRAPLRLQFFAPSVKSGTDVLTLSLTPANLVGLSVGVARAKGTGCGGGGNLPMPEKPGVYVLTCDPPVFLAVGKEPSGKVKRIACTVPLNEAMNLLESLRAALAGDPIAETTIQAASVADKRIASLPQLAGGKAASAEPSTMAWVQ